MAYIFFKMKFFKKSRQLFVASDKLWILREVLHFGKCASVNMKSVLLNSPSILRRLVVKNYVALLSFFFLNIATQWRSRWWNIKTWHPPLSTKTLKIHLYMGRFSQNAYWTLAGLIQPKLQERSPHNQVGPNNNNKSNLDETCNPERESWKNKGSVTLGTPFTSWDINQDR